MTGINLRTVDSIKRTKIDMDNKIVFTYNPWVYYNSYKNVLYNVRKYYTESDIIVFFDGNRTDLDLYLKTAEDYNCITIVRDTEVGFINKNDSIEQNLPKQFEWISRMKLACELSNAEWVMLLEDDVLVKRVIQSWPNSDVGTNRKGVGFLGGGSVFKRDIFLTAIEHIGMDNMKNLIKTNHTISWAGDMLLKILFDAIHTSSEKWVELAEPGYFDKADHAVFHGYKDLHKLG
jgi:hypothetical protein